MISAATRVARRIGQGAFGAAAGLCVLTICGVALAVTLLCAAPLSRLRA